MAHNNKKPGFSNKATSPASPAAKSSSNYSFTISEQKKQKKSSRIPSWVWVSITPIIIAAAGIYYLFMQNSEVLFMAQDRSFFSSDQSFLTQSLLQPDGLICYVSSYLTQLFYNPMAGTLALIAIWIATFFISKKAFEVPSSLAGILAVPAAALIIGIVGVGYWLYYIKQPGYWFVGSVGYLASMVLVLIHRLLYCKNNSSTAFMSLRILWIILTAASFFYFGWFSLLALLYIAVNSYFLWRKTQGRKVIDLITNTAIPVIAAAVTPLIAYNVFCEIRFEEIWTCGLPRFEQGLSDNTPIELDPKQTTPYIVLAVLPLFLPILSLFKNKINAVISICVNIAVLVVLGLWINAFEYTDYNFKAECRMYKATMDNDWDKVLSEMAGLPNDATREMVLLKNIALFNKGTIGDQMFKYNNMGRDPYVPDTIAIRPRLDADGKETKTESGQVLNDTIMLHPHLVQTAAPLIYYHHGKTNFSYRWIIENMVEYGPKNGDLQLLAMNSLVNGEMEVAKKYLTLLQSTPNYKEWADRYMPITSTPSKIKDFHEFDHICELRDNMGTTLDGDNGLPEMYLISYFANTMNKDNAYLQEMTLVYSLVNKDIQLFWPRFFLYAQMHKDVKSMPRHYQEAAYLYGNLEHSVDISRLPFDKEVITSYQSFQSTSQQLMQTQQRLTGKIDEVQVANEMKELYGDTFYWFYFFCRGVHSY